MERLPRNLPAILLAAALAVGVVMILVLTSGMTFFQDTWGILMERRDFTAESLFHPHNEHIVVFPVLIEWLFLHAFGMDTALPEYVLLALSLSAVAGLLYVYVQRRLGPWLALFAAVLVLCLGPAWEVLLWPFQIGYTGSVFFGLATLLALERGDRRGDVLACACLVFALGFSSLGIPFLVGAAVAVLQGDRARWVSRAYVVAIPALLFAAWYVGWGHDAESHLSIRNLAASPRFVAETVAVALGSLFGLGANPSGLSSEPVWGRAMLVALVAVFGYVLWRRPKVHPGLWPVAAAATTNWFLTAFNYFPGREPVASRYQYASAIFILLILANLLPGLRPKARTLVLAGAVTALAIGPNLVVLKEGRDLLKDQSVYTRTDTGAIEIARRTVAPNFQLTPEIAGTPSLINVYAGKYLDAVDEFGSPAYTPEELVTAPEGARRQADIVLSQALPISTVTQLGAYAGGVAENCVVVPPGAGSDIAVGAGTTRIEVAPGEPAQFSLRRFAVADFPVPTEGAPGGSTTMLRIPRDLAPQYPWRLNVAAEQEARVCR